MWKESQDLQISNPKFKVENLTFKIESCSIINCIRLIKLKKKKMTKNIFYISLSNLTQLTFYYCMDQ